MILDRVKEPESGLSVAQLGLVHKCRLNQNRGKLYLYISPIAPSKGCCALISTMLLDTTLESLTREFKKAFPEFSIQLI